MEKIPLPSNPWLRRRRLKGAEYEVARLYALACDLIHHTPESERLQALIGFLSSQYKAHAVYYNFVRMPGIRRVGWYIWKRFTKEFRHERYGD